MEIRDLFSVIPAELADNSSVWIFQSSRPLGDKEVVEMNDQLHHFYSQWKSHGDPVKGWAQVFFNRYVVIIADENTIKLGGCSKDDSMRVIKSFERQYQITLFDRLSITFLIKDKIEMLPLNQVQYAIDKGFISKDTLMFNNLVATKKEFVEKWLSPISETWLAGRVLLGVG